jgi:hypothetical protein
MSGGAHRFPFEWMTDLIIGRLLEPKEAEQLTEPQLEVLGAHIRSEILFSPEVHKILSVKAKDVLKELLE